MTHPQHFLFAICVVGSAQTVFYNFKQTLAKRPSIRSSWLPLTDELNHRIAGVLRMILPPTVRRVVSAWWKLREIKKERGGVDAAFILDRRMGGPVMSVWRTVPFVLSTDMTPVLWERQRTIAEQRDTPALSLPARLGRRLARVAYMRAYRILPWSTVVRDSLVKDYGIPEDRITVLPPGINLRRWSAPDRSSTSERRLVVLHVSIDFVLKGGDVVLELAREAEFKDIEFHFVTPSEVGPVPENVVIHGSLKPNSEPLQKVYEEADVLLLPTRADTFSIVTLEAMASSLPVIATDVGGMRDLIEDGRTGFLVPSGDLEALRDRLRRLRGDAGLRIRMGQEGRNRAEAHFDLHRHVETVMTLLGEASKSREQIA